MCGSCTSRSIWNSFAPWRRNSPAPEVPRLFRFRWNGGRPHVLPPCECGVPAMMVTLSRLFPDAATARAVVDELKAAGLPEDDIGIIAQSRTIPMENADMGNVGDEIDRDLDGHDDRGETVNKSAGIGAALGGAAGLLAGLGAFVLPGIGTVIAAGWL